MNPLSTLSRRALIAGAAASLALSTALIPAATASAAAAPGCREAHIVRDLYAFGIRAASYHLKQYWCWNGYRITQVGTPQQYYTSTFLGTYTVQTSNLSIQQQDKDPQFGGYWTHEDLLTGSIDICILKYGCARHIPLRMDLYVFGDGVQYIAA